MTYWVNHQGEPRNFWGGFAPAVRTTGRVSGFRDLLYKHWKCVKPEKEEFHYFPLKSQGEGRKYRRAKKRGLPPTYIRTLNGIVFSEGNGTHSNIIQGLHISGFSPLQLARSSLIIIFISLSLCRPDAGCLRYIIYCNLCNTYLGHIVKINPHLVLIFQIRRLSVKQHAQVTLSNWWSQDSNSALFHYKAPTCPVIYYPVNCLCNLTEK